MDHRIIFDVSDLDRISFECSKCGTEMVLRVSDKRPFPPHCPTCGESHSQGDQASLADVLDVYRNFFQRATAEGVKVKLIANPSRQIGHP